MEFEQDKRLARVLISEEEIKKRVSEAGRRISEEYKDKPLVMICILKGSFVFASDLCRAVDIPCRIEFMRVRSYYEGTQSSGSVDILLDTDNDLSGSHVLVVEDIVDSGRTLCRLTELLRKRNPLSLRTITLLDKPSRRAEEFHTDISLFSIPDLFVVGYGLDYNEMYRNLPYIAVYEEVR